MATLVKRTTYAAIKNILLKLENLLPSAIFWENRVRNLLIFVISNIILLDFLVSDIPYPSLPFP